MKEKLYHLAEQMGMTSVLNYFFAAGGTLLCVLGGWDVPLKALIVMMVLDYLTGVIAAIVTRQLSSGVGFRGILKKFVILAVVALASQIDQFTGTTNVARSAALFFYITNEGISLLENACRAGIPIPAALRRILLQLRQRQG